METTTKVNVFPLTEVLVGAVKAWKINLWIMPNAKDLLVHSAFTATPRLEEIYTYGFLLQIRSFVTSLEENMYNFEENSEIMHIFSLLKRTQSTKHIITNSGRESLHNHYIISYFEFQLIQKSFL